MPLRPSLRPPVLSQEASTSTERPLGMAIQKRTSRWWVDQNPLDTDHWTSAFGRAAAPRGAAILSPKSVAGDLSERGFRFRDKAFDFTLVAGEPCATRRHCRKALSALITVAIPGPVSSDHQQRCDRLDQRAGLPSHLPVGSARRGHPRRRDGEKLPSIVERGS
jgi:hypothetical protein